MWGVQAIGSLPARTHPPEVENRRRNSHKATGVCFLMASWGDLHTPLLSTWFRQDSRAVFSELKSDSVSWTLNVFKSKGSSELHKKCWKSNADQNAPVGLLTKTLVQISSVSKEILIGALPSRGLSHTPSPSCGAAPS